MENKETTITVRIKKADKEKIEAAARKSYFSSISEFIRVKILELVNK